MFSLQKMSGNFSYLGFQLQKPAEFAKATQINILTHWLILINILTHWLIQGNFCCFVLVCVANTFESEFTNFLWFSQDDFLNF